jgi:hypothetical protein
MMAPPSTYCPRDRDRGKHSRLIAEAVEGIPYLTEDDMLVLMGADLSLCTEWDRQLARSDLYVCGYRRGLVALHGRPRVFPRWIKVDREESWLDSANVPMPRTPPGFYPSR